MTVAQRKKNLLTWIHEIEDEAVLSQVEALRQATTEEELPMPIMQLLEKSRQSPEESLIPHRPVRELLGK